MTPKHLYTPRRHEEDPAKRRSYGQRHGGVRTVEDIFHRCVINEDTGCWEWQGSRSQGKGGHIHIVPTMWVPALGTLTTGMRAVAILSGKIAADAPASVIVWRVCRCRTCLNPEHLRTGTRAEWGAEMAARGAMSGAWRKAANIKGAKAKRKLSDEQSREILVSSDTCEALAARYGVSKSTISRVRRGQRYTERQIPGASVFSWAAAAP